MSRKHRNALREQRAGEVTTDNAPEDTLPPLRDLPGPYAVGWAVRYDAGNGGYRRVRIRIPLDVLEQLAVEPEHGPDHRSTQAAWITRELMADATLADIHRGAEQ